MNIDVKMENVLNKSRIIKTKLQNYNSIQTFLFATPSFFHFLSCGSLTLMLGQKCCFITKEITDSCQTSKNNVTVNFSQKKGLMFLYYFHFVVFADYSDFG